MRKKRPSFLTKDLADRLIREMRTGKSVAQVALTCGIVRGTFYKYLRLGKQNPKSVFGYLRKAYDQFRKDGSPVDLD